ncbi:hypothetical protein LB506_004383 [Fusarium annulatum]|nr:hypothetical protein LB506_004383 [Fusarium annulatum]
MSSTTTAISECFSASSLDLSSQLTPLSPMENERTPDGPFVMQHRAVESFTVEQKSLGLEIESRS